MNKKIKQTATALLATCALMLASCQHEEIETNNFPADGIIRVTTRVANSALDDPNGPETRAGYTNENFDMPFVLNIVPTDGDANYSYYAMMAKLGNGSWGSLKPEDNAPLTMRPCKKYILNSSLTYCEKDFVSL